MTPRARAALLAALTPVLLSGSWTLSLPAPAAGQAPFGIEDVLSPAFPFDLVSARTADRIAWIEFERGMRNVWTAAAPDFVPRRLTEGLHDDGHDLAGLQISGDGAVVAFLRGHTPNREGWVANPTSDPRGAERAVWAAHTSGGEPWRVVEARSFALSPDGRWVAFERDDQVWRAPVDPGAQREAAPPDAPLFRAFGRNGDPVWSPDGRRLAFVSQRGDHAFVGVYDTEARKVTYLAPSVDRDQAPAWSPDGTRLAFIRRPGLPFGAQGSREGGPPRPREGQVPAGLVEAAFAGGYTFSVWVADARTGEGRELWHNAPGDTVHEEVRSLLWADGHLLFQAEPAGWRHTFSLAADGTPAEPVLLTPGEGIAEHMALSPDGRTLYYATNVGDLDRRHLWKVPVAGGRAVRLTGGSGIETYPVVLASQDRVAVLHAGASLPQSVALVPSAGGEPRVITALPAAFPRSRHVTPTDVVITAEDGFETHNQLFLPPEGTGPEGRKPALVFIHGGSRRQMLLGYHYMHFYHMAYAMNQYFANRGYVVLSVNYRSGIGYGREFRDAPGRGGQGNTEYRDVLAAGKYLPGRPDVDPGRIGVWGLSYVGILTAQALARNSDVFAAGVDIAGVHLWGSSLDPESTSFQSSSVSQVERWRSPVLLIHGDDDRNVAFSQTVGLVQALRAHGVPHELMVFPDEVHDFLVFERWLQTFHATDDFFQRTLVRREPVAAGGRLPKP